ncbi:MAG: threonine dehydratase [Hyphomicrobiaceae bacterium]
MFTLDQFHAAADLVHRHVQPTLQYNWPLLAKRTGCDVWVKHENQTPTGAFKVRGGIVYLDDYVRAKDGTEGLITATTGNHGQSIPWAARLHGVPVTIYAPEGNSPEKNTAMRALGAQLVEFGSDFDEAWPESQRVAAERNLHFVKSFHELLVRGVATYALEFLSAHDDLDTVYVPIGMGSGICGVIRTRDLLGLKTKVVGVIAEQAPAIAQSFAAGRPVPSNSSATFAAGVATRSPVKEAIDMICAGADRIVQVSETEMADAMRAYFHDTHNAVEGAGAAPLAGLIKESAAMAGHKVGLILTGGNIDGAEFAKALSGGIPQRG